MNSSIIVRLFIAFTLAFSFGKTALAELINITLLQLNDVYEISPVAGGKEGGLARVATIRKSLLEKNPHTYTFLAGDCFSPSGLGTARVGGEELAGQQMVAVLNVMGLDYATFGNHEFDLSKNQFLRRLAESNFTWISSNVLDVNDRNFPGVLSYKIIAITGDKGDKIRIGLIGLTLDSNPADYVSYQDPIATAKEQVKYLQDKVDIIIAITHLPLSQDQKLAETIPEIDLILGGHEHENIQQWRGKDFTPVFKADANAKTIYIHQLYYDTETNQLKIESHLQPVTDAIAADRETATIVENWLEKGYQAFREDGFAPQQVVGVTPVPLDGLEVSVRNQSTQLTDLIAQAMLNTLNDADLAIYNSGSIRIDDVIPAGAITQYDIIRILPFGGKILSVTVKGSLLERVLNQGRSNRGNGGYLQTAKVDFDGNDKKWLIAGQALDINKTYNVAISEFLLTGKEQNLGFLNLQNPEVELIAEGEDIRQALIKYIQNYDWTK